MRDNKAEPHPASPSPNLSNPDQSLAAKFWSHKTYLLTGVIGLLSPLIIVYLYSAGTTVFHFIAFFVFIIIAALYLFYAFSRFLIDEFDFQKIRFPTALFSVSLGLDMGLIVLFLMVYQHHPLVYQPAEVTLPEMIGYYTALFTSFALSTSFILLSFELAELPHNLFGFLKPLRYTFLTLSLFLILSNLANVNSYLSKVPLIVGLSIFVIRLSDIFILLTLTVACILISLSFLFFVIRDVVPPATD